MKLQIRSKAGGVLEVFDEAGNRVEGVVSIEMKKAETGEVPEVTVVFNPGVVVNADTEQKSKQAEQAAKSKSATAAYSGPAEQWPAAGDKK